MMATWARSTSSILTPVGRKSGSMKEAMNSRLISGTPRMSSMYKRGQDADLTGMRERRPRARKIDIGKAYRQADDGENERQRKAAPQVVGHERQPRNATPHQQQPDRQSHQPRLGQAQAPGIAIATGGDHAHEQHKAEQGAPLLPVRVTPEQDEAVLFVNHRPAGTAGFLADRRGRRRPTPHAPRPNRTAAAALSPAGTAPPGSGRC